MSKGVRVRGAPTITPGTYDDGTTVPEFHAVTGHIDKYKALGKRIRLSAPAVHIQCHLHTPVLKWLIQGLYSLFTGLPILQPHVKFFRKARIPFFSKEVSEPCSTGCIEVRTLCQTIDEQLAKAWCIGIGNLGTVSISYCCASFEIDPGWFQLLIAATLSAPVPVKWHHDMLV